MRFRTAFKAIQRRLAGEIPHLMVRGFARRVKPPKHLFDVEAPRKELLLLLGPGSLGRFPSFLVFLGPESATETRPKVGNSETHSFQRRTDNNRRSDIIAGDSVEKWTLMSLRKSIYSWVLKPCFKPRVSAGPGRPVTARRSWACGHKA